MLRGGGARRQYARESIAVGGATLRALAAERLVMSLPGGAPTFQFRADTVTLSGGNVATIPNRRGSDALVLAAGTLAAPAGDALFAGALSALFTGTQRLQSNLAASAWKFMHDGTGCEVFTVFAPTNVSAGTRILLSTRTGSANGNTLFLSAASQGFVVNNGAASIINNTAGTLVVNTATYSDQYYGATEPLNFANFSGTSVVGSGSVAAASSGDPQNPLTLGARPDGTNGAEMRWCETLIFPRVLHEYERQIVREYFAARYGIAAPSLTGPDREIMSLLPFSWLDAAVANISGGKVTLFPDRARPGHFYVQGSGTNQVATPTADASFNGSVSATFVSGSVNWYGSSLPTSAWRHLHNGAGMQIVMPFLSTAAGVEALLCSMSGGNTTGFRLYKDSSQNLQCTVTNSAFGTDPIGTSVAGGTTATTSAVRCANVKHATALAPDFAFLERGVSIASGNYATSPAAGDSTGSLRIGAQVNAVLPGSFRTPGFVSFSRTLTTAEEARLSAAILAKFGVAA